MEIRIFNWIEAQETLAREWTGLVDELGINPSHDPRWMDATVRSHELCDEARVAALFDGNRLRGVFPFRQRRLHSLGLPLLGIEPLTNLVSYHAQLIAAKDDAHRLLGGVLEHPLLAPWDLLHFDNVPIGSATAGLLERIGKERGSRMIRRDGENSPYIKISGDWQQYLATRNNKFRVNATRAIRKMAEAGETGMAWYIGADHSGQLLEQILAIEELSWKADAGIAIQQNPMEEAYHALLIPTLSEMGALFANVLLVHERPVAYVLCCHHHGWIGQLKTSFDKQLAAAGARVIDASVQRAFGEGAEVYDFLGDAAPHKLKWTHDLCTHGNYWIYSRRLLPSFIGAMKQLQERRQPPPPAAAGPATADH